MSISKFDRRYRFYLPEFCRNTVLFAVVATVQIVAIVFTLLIYEQDFFRELGLVSLYLQWVSLSVCSLLCLFRKRLMMLAENKAYLLSLLLIVGCFSIVELLTQRFTFPPTVGFDVTRYLRLCVISVLIGVLVLYWFRLVGKIDHRSRAEAESRVQSLQARIRPHFLFNSLNSISELVATQPQQAEQAIEGLSLLFRASLEGDNRFHSLESEINLCKRYLELERWRLEERLSCIWTVEVADAALAQVPKLILQPLVENAVVHGVKLDGSVEITIEIRETKNDLLLKVQNTVAAGTPKHAGNGIAVENIRERLLVIYDDQQTFSAKAAAELYSVILRFPKSKPAENRAFI